MKRILVLTEWFFPANKANELITPCHDLVNELSPQHCFYVLTSDRDMGDRSPLKGIATNEWTNLTNKSVVRYVPKNQMTAAALKQIIKKINPHAIYVNTVLSWRYSLMPLYLLHKSGFTGKIIISPRGVLHHNVFGINALKRHCFNFLYARIRSHGNVLFHVTNEQEATHVKKHFANNTLILIVENRDLFFPSFQPVTSKRNSGAVVS